LVVELGSGSGSKTRWILSAMAARQPIAYCPIDISESALYRCCLELGTIDAVNVVPIAQSYLEGLQEALRLRPAGTSALVLFLGSTIGNFEPDRAIEFLGSVRALLEPGDIFYVSADLEKNAPRMLAAYSDSIGATAAFNLNLLARINRELGGTFVLPQFRHQVRYNRIAHRIEMHLESLMDQIVSIGRDFRASLKAGETIWTESSYKFHRDDLRVMARSSGFVCEIQWVDDEWPFSQSVFRAV
ncbi:MAG TPA: L-histidine N(alpha)-methyltransferase, partial [Terriglobia bacterium]|nr:L-histidine N(alpha)-methyltransferase [Terriglobia bacterium]